MSHEAIHRWSLFALAACVLLFVQVGAAALMFEAAVIDPHDWVPTGKNTPLEIAPGGVLASAAPGDVVDTVKPLYYWGRKDVPYGNEATNEKQTPKAIVMHFTRTGPVMNFVKYQHNGDAQRGGHFGYHVYVDPKGEVVQGAPLSIRTNHIKPPGHEKRKGLRPDLSNANTVAVSLTGACASRSGRCGQETITEAQFQSAFRVVIDLMQQFHIPCTEVYGHGELQHDRDDFEGLTVATAIRKSCKIELAGR